MDEMVDDIPHREGEGRLDDRILSSLLIGGEGSEREPMPAGDENSKRLYVHVLEKARKYLDPSCYEMRQSVEDFRTLMEKSG
jgi:hypothetical protein